MPGRTEAEAVSRDADARGPVVAMVGAGQLAQMTHQAAIGLGVTLRVLAAGTSDPAVRAGAECRTGSPDSLEDLLAFAAGAEVVTFDHEQIPPEHLRELAAAGVRLAPSPEAKLFAQDKLHARRRLAEFGFPVPPFAHAGGAEEVTAFAERYGWPVVAKPPRGGYDGRGVFELADPQAAEAMLREHPAGLLLEPRLEIERELAVLVARSTAGERAVYPVVETVQRDAMCREILAPAPISEELSEQARSMAEAIAEAIDATGLLALELFHTGGGLIVNELALRPHNSGHYTIEGCVTSQFEQHLRAVLGWPLGSSELRAPAVCTVNVVGTGADEDPRERAARALGDPDVHIHLYGKSPRPGRKLGHVTVSGRDPGAAREAARLAAARLEGTSER